MRRDGILPVLLCLWLSLAGSGVEMAYSAQSLTATVTHQDSSSDGESQRSNITYALNLGQEVTEAISLNETLRYTRNRTEGRTTETIDPSLRFILKNDIFGWELFGSATERRDSTSANRTRQAWESAVASNWQKRFWPGVRLSYGEDYAEDDEDPKTTDAKNSKESATVDWDLELFKAYYNFSRDRDLDKASGGRTKNTSHFGKLETGSSLLDDRLEWGLTQQYTLSRSESSTAASSSGIAEIKRTASQVLSGRDDTPLEMTSGELTFNSKLTDTDTESTAGISTNGNDDPPLNIAVKLNFSQVDTIYLYTVDDESARASGFRFDLYVSNVSDGSTWQKAATDLSFTYSVNRRRFEISTGDRSHLWIKLVVTDSPFQEISFTEVELYDLVATSSGAVQSFSETTTTLTDVNVSYLVTSSLDIAYSLSVEYGEYSSGVDYNRRSQTGGVRWAPFRLLTSSLEFNETREQNGSEPDVINRRYGVNLHSPPLPTLDLTLNASRQDSYLGQDLQKMAYDVGFYTAAALYPDLDGNLDLTYRRTKDDQTGALGREYGSRLVLTARLIPEVTLSGQGEYQRRKAESVVDTIDSTVNCNWRVSDILSLNVSGKKSWEEGVSQGESATFALAVAPTDRLQASFSASYSKSEQRSNSYSGFVSWALGPNLTFQLNSSYATSGDEESWTVRAQMVANFITQ